MKTQSRKNLQGDGISLCSWSEEDENRNNIEDKVQHTVVQVRKSRKPSLAVFNKEMTIEG